MLRRLNPQVSALTMGLLTGFVYYVPVFVGGNSGTLCTYLTILLLLLTGLSSGFVTVFVASLTASVVVALAIGLSDALFFAVLIVLPIGYFVHGVLRWRGDEASHEWYPVLRVLAEMTLIVVGLFLVADVIAAMQDDGGLQAILLHEFSGATDLSDNAEVNKALALLTQKWGFLLLASMGWSWVLTIYAFAVLANSLLANHRRALRSRLGLLVQGGLPEWLLVLATMSAAAAFLGNEAEQFSGKTMLLLLMLPYFLAGLARLHQFSAKFPFHKLWLTLFYCLLIVVWPVTFLVIGSGFYTQLLEILDRRHKMR